MQCHLNGVHNSEVPNYLAESLSAAQLLFILLQLSSVTSFFDVYSLRMAENIPKIHVTAEEPPWDPSANKYSEKETYMLDH